MIFILNAMRETMRVPAISRFDQTGDETCGANIEKL